MKKASILIVVSFVIASLLCLVSCSTSTSTEYEPTTEGSQIKISSDDDDSTDDSSDDAEQDSSSSDAADIEISSDENDSSADSLDADTTGEKYTNKEAGFSVALPSYWYCSDLEGLREDYDISDALRILFVCQDAIYEEIRCYAYSGFEDVSFSDLTPEYIADGSSVPLDSITQKELSSGTYYLFKARQQNSSNGKFSYRVGYVTVKNSYLFEFEYISTLDETNTPHLGDFEYMVSTIEY